jgi:hypothetical protein
MFPREKIDRACKECHPDPAERIVMGARYCLHIPEGPEVGKTCTECHGAHRMAVRTVHWDRTTGKLLEGNAQ